MEIVVTKIPETKTKDEMFWFEFEGNQVRFLWKTLDPSIASWVFLLYDIVKKAREQRNIAKEKKKNLQVEYDSCRDKISEQREYLNGLIRKAEYLEIQNKDWKNDSIVAKHKNIRPEQVLKLLGLLVKLCVRLKLRCS